jgi:hypothetical protein
MNRTTKLGGTQNGKSFIWLGTRTLLGGDFDSKPWEWSEEMEKKQKVNPDEMVCTERFRREKRTWARDLLSDIVKRIMR